MDRSRTVHHTLSPEPLSACASPLGSPSQSQALAPSSSQNNKKSPSKADGMKATGYGTLTMWPTRYEMLKRARGHAMGSLQCLNTVRDQPRTRQLLPCPALPGPPHLIYCVLTQPE